jgi:hypothetical protein
MTVAMSPPRNTKGHTPNSKTVVQVNARRRARTPCTSAGVLLQKSLLLRPISVVKPKSKVLLPPGQRYSKFTEFRSESGTTTSMFHESDSSSGCGVLWEIRDINGVIRREERCDSLTGICCVKTAPKKGISSFEPANQIGNGAEDVKETTPSTVGKAQCCGFPALLTKTCAPFFLRHSSSVFIKGHITLQSPGREDIGSTRSPYWNASPRNTLKSQSGIAR